MSRRVWTADDVQALGVRTDLVTACRIVYGCGKNRAWELYHDGQLGFPTMRVGRRVVVPVAPLLALLHLTPDTSEAGAVTPAVAVAPIEEPSRGHDDTATRLRSTA